MIVGRASGTAKTVACAALLFAAGADAREIGVEEWVDERLAPYVAKTLAEHPRFKGTAVRFVVMRNGSPQPAVDQLSLRLRDRLQRRVVDSPGVIVAWRPDRADPDSRLPQTGVDCSADEAQYLIGLELTATGSGSAHLSVRALDTVEKAWVSAFGREWRGKLNRGQRRALQQGTLDRSYLGARDVPYDRNETDLMAAHLAHELRCELMRQVTGDYVVGSPDADAGADDLPGVLELVSNNVAGLSSLRFAADAGQANATLAGQAHPVDGDLHQYWITLTPTDAGSELQPISTSVYVRVPLKYLSATPVAGAADSVALASGGILQSLSLVRLESTSACRARVSGYDNGRYLDRRRDCLGLEIRTRDDAVVFVLNHQLNNGLVRLDDRQCDYRTAARIARANEAITVPLPTDLLRDGWLPEDEWRLDPNADTYYAIAVSDSAAARALASHLDRLPRRCSESVRVGYEGRELERWLAGLSAAIERWQPHVDWNAIRIKNVY